MNLSQRRLAIELRLACDTAMTVNPSQGKANGAAMRRVRALLRANPEWESMSHVVHNLGARRIAWLTRVQG